MGAGYYNTTGQSVFFVRYQLPPGWFLEPSRHGTVGSHTHPPAPVGKGSRQKRRVKQRPKPTPSPLTSFVIHLTYYHLLPPTSDLLHRLGRIGSHPGSRVSSSGRPRTSDTNHPRGVAPSTGVDTGCTESESISMIRSWVGTVVGTGTDGNTKRTLFRFTPSLLYTADFALPNVTGGFATSGHPYSESEAILRLARERDEGAVSEPGELLRQGAASPASRFRMKQSSVV